MKKITVGLLVLMLIGMTLFVSCSNEPKSIDEGVGSVKFIGSDSASVSRGLTRTNPTFDAGSMVWMYEAKKTDTSGLKTGETSRKTLVGEDGNITNEVGPFSQGIWEFTLYAYENDDNADADKYAYKGVASNVKITSASTNSVRVTVDAQQSESGTGFIEVAKNITLQDANGNSISEHNEKIILTNLADSNDEPHVYTNSSDRSFEVSSGAWKVNVIFYDTQNPEINYGNNVIYVNVYDNLTTKVGGSLDEITASTKFVTDSGVTTAISDPATIDNISEKTLSVSSTPVAVQDTENNTAVIIPANATVSGDAVLSVTPYVAKDAEPRFSVQAGSTGTAVAGLDVTVAINDVLVEKFNKAITITTFIAKGIDGTVDVKYNGEGDQPQNVTYNKNTGALSFTTTHLSEYYVVADIAAINTTSNTAYATLSVAVSSASEGDTILMLKDFANTDYSNAVNLGLKKNAVLDGNGHNIEGNVSVYVNAGGGTIRNVVFKNIHNSTKIENDSYPYYFNNKRGNKTPVYASGLSGELVIKNCVFDTFDWDAIQTTPVAGASIEIVGNTFKFNQYNTVGISQPVRYVHIESNYNVDFRAVVTGNFFLNCSYLNQTALEVYYPEYKNKIEVSGNYVDDPVAVCLYYGYGYNGAELALPFSGGPNGELAFDSVCRYRLNNGNTKFLNNLDDIEEIGATAYLVKDIDLENPLYLKGNINLNGHSIINETGTAIVVDNKNVSISGSGTVSGTNAITIMNEGSLSLTGGKYVSTSRNGINVGTYDNGNYTTGSLTVTGSSVTIEAQEFAVGVYGNSSLNIAKGTFTSKDNAVIGTNGSDPLKNCNYNITISGGTFNGHIQSPGYIACGIYMANSGKVTLNGGVFNIEGGIGVLVRSGELTANKVSINLTEKKGLSSGKIGDSNVQITTESQIVINGSAGYPGIAPSIDENTTGYTPKNPDGTDYTTEQ